MSKPVKLHTTKSISKLLGISEARVRKLVKGFYAGERSDVKGFKVIGIQGTFHLFYKGEHSIEIIDD